MSLLEIQNLEVQFRLKAQGIFRRRIRTIYAVNDVGFHIAESETLGLVGESGCGKTTTGRAIAKLVRAQSGSIVFEGRDIRPLRRRDLGDFRQKCQIVFQNPYSSLDPRMTVRQILEEPLRMLSGLSRVERLQKVQDLMEEVHLDPKFIDRYPHEFSGGQRQRINIARALSVRPKLIVADEPVSALDVSIQAQIVNLLQELQSKFKMAFLFIAHDLSVVRALSKRVAVMYLGRIVEIGITENLYSRPMHPYSKALLSAVPIPDPKKERSRNRISVQGEIPSPMDLPSGCAFHPRCPFARETCRKERPELRQIPGGTQVACHFAEEIA